MVVPESENEVVPKLAVEISELLGVEINQKNVSVAHRLPAKNNSDDSKKPDPPAIIARFVSRSVRNEIYNNRKFAKTIREVDLRTQGSRARPTTQKIRGKG